MTIETSRLILRPWEESDLKPFAQLNADPRVMEHFPAVKNLQQSKEEFQRIVAHFEKFGWGFWAVSVINGAQFIGFIGLRYDDFPAPFTPAVEIGWRVAFDHWGRGYATEAGQAALAYGFKTLHLEEIVSFTTVQNRRSRAVMERLGMRHEVKDDFDHPKLPEGHPLRRHVLYRLRYRQWLKDG